MMPYLKKILDGFPEEIATTALTPATENLFKVQDGKYGRPLPEKQAAQFHHAVEHRFFYSGRVRRYFQTAVTFLATRVKAPDKNNWGKLKRVMTYIKGSLVVNLTLMADSLFVINWWVDVSFSTNKYFRGHTDGMMSLGSGAITNGSWKQKINGRSSMYNNLIGVNGIMVPVF